MSEENRREIYKALREEQKKYTYFLLAVSGAAIALAVNKTQMLTLEWSQAPRDTIGRFYVKFAL